MSFDNHVPDHQGQDQGGIHRRQLLRSSLGFGLAGMAGAGFARGASEVAKELRVGIIGTDTSHCGVFARSLNDPENKDHITGARIVAAYPSFSPDVESSVKRVEGYKKELAEKHGIRITGSIEELLPQVDAVLLLSVDGRRHLKEIRPVIEAGKPVFVDKPFAASLADAKEIVALAKQHKVPCFGGSSLRFDSAVQKMTREDKGRGRIMGCDAFSPAHQEPTNPGLFWYGVHGVEILFTIMGPGCQSVHSTRLTDGEVTVGTWQDGRLGTMRGIRKGGGAYGALVLCEKGPPQLILSAGDYYLNLLRAIIDFFRTGKAPTPLEETLEICAFMDAALRSADNQGCEVKLNL